MNIEKYQAIAEDRELRIAACCGSSLPLCGRCRISKKIVDAWQRYEHSVINDWPEEVPVCEKCGSMSKVGKWAVSNDDPDSGWDICQVCYADEDGFTAWLANELKTALDESDEYELLPNGNYRFIGDR